MHRAMTTSDLWRGSRWREMLSVAARERLRTANAILAMKLPNECSDNPRVTPQVRLGSARPDSST